MEIEEGSVIFFFDTRGGVENFYTKGSKIHTRSEARITLNIRGSASVDRK